MKYKLIILIITSIALQATSDDDRIARIKELEQLQFEYESKITELSDQILQGANALETYKSIALRYWEDSEEEFDIFLDEFSDAYIAGEDVIPILEKKSLIKKYGDNIDTVMFKVVIQDAHLNKLLINLKKLIQKLLVINKELKSLES